MQREISIRWNYLRNHILLKKKFFKVNWKTRSTETEFRTRYSYKFQLKGNEKIFEIINIIRKVRSVEENNNYIVQTESNWISSI